MKFNTKNKNELLIAKLLIKIIRNAKEQTKFHKEVLRLWKQAIHEEKSK